MRGKCCWWIIGPLGARPAGRCSRIPWNSAADTPIAGLAVVSVSLDDADAESEAREFLGEQGATFENLRVASGASPKSVSLLNIENGAIPFLQLYDRTGKLRKTFSGLTNPALIDEAVERLLAEG